MRIWHEKLIPKLCRQHLLAVWRESLGAWKIITEDKRGYRNHPAVKEFELANFQLLKRLHVIRREMLRRGYHPKEVPTFPCHKLTFGKVKTWEPLRMQVEKLRAKGCDCRV